MPDTLRLSPEPRDLTEAIESTPAVNEWQVLEIQAAVAEADKGEFATSQQEAEFRAKWSLNAS